MKEIKLSKNAVALVDDEDFERLNQFTWCLELTGYAGRKLRVAETGGIRNIGRLMHHELLPGVVKGKIHVDHIDGNRLNNQKGNLRYATHSQNLMNRPPKSKLGLYGVRIISRSPGKPYHAYININGKQKHLGYYATAELAAAAYDTACKAHPDAEFRHLNNAA